MQDSQLTRCKYISKEGIPCNGFTQDAEGLCFWHNPDASKKGQDIKEKLVAWVSEGNSLEGVHLAYADLSGLKIPRNDNEKLFNFRNADLHRANLQGAHLYAVDFTGSSLLKADFSHANINRAKLDDTNLLGTVFYQAKIEDVKWGKQIHQEKDAITLRKKGFWQQSEQNFTEAEEIYRYLRMECEGRGLYSDAGNFHYRERVMHHYLLPKYSVAWCLSKLVHTVCGYGESAARVVTFSLGIIFIAALAYMFLPLNTDQVVNFSSANSLLQNLQALGNCMYYSVVTFTTLGYGEITPIGPTKFVAALEAFIGAFSMALFVVVFVRKMTS